MTRFKLAVLLALTAGPLQAKPRAPLPDADALVLKALAGPATGYLAVQRVQVFLPGKKPKALKVNVAALPGGRIKLEVLGKKNTPVLIQIRDGKFPEAPTKGLARLRSLYDLSVSTGGVVAKRKTWKVELRLKSGVLRRALWVDRDSGLLMKRETYRDDGSLRRRERLVKLELPTLVDSALFKRPTQETNFWAPDGFVCVKQGDNVYTFSNGLETYTVVWNERERKVTGDLVEDDVAHVLEPIGEAL